MFITIENLCKSFGDKAVVRSLSLEINESEVFGLLGPNGAGKSTLIHMIHGLLAPDSGTIKFPWGADPQQASQRKLCGLAPQDLALYQELSAEDNLRFFGRLYGLQGAKLSDRVAWALDLAELKPRRHERVEHFSGGMKRRLNLACALIHEPKFVCLDEPTVGVDPQSRRHIFDTIHKLKREGLTLIYTTHYMEEARELCDRIAIVDHGQILDCGTHAELLAKHGAPDKLRVETKQAITADFDRVTQLEPNLLEFSDRKLVDVVNFCQDNDLEINSIQVVEADLESVFLKLTGRTLRD